MSSILLRFSSQSSDITYRVHNAHRSAHLLQQQTSITVYRLTTKENKLSFCFLFAENKWKTTVSVFRIYIYMDKYWNGSIYSIYIYISISLFVYIYVMYMYMDMYMYIYKYIYAAVSNGKQKNRSPVIFLNPFTVCSSCRRKFVVCPFVYEERNGSLHLNRLNGLNGLAHLW